MNSTALRAVLAGALAGLAAWGFQRLNSAPAIAIAGACVVAFVAWALPNVGVATLDRIVHAARALHWRHEQGRHHAFGGLPLDIVDDGHHVWVAGADLQRVLGTQDPEEVLAARHSGRWRRDERGILLLRVDAVVARLATAPGRLDPRMQRLRLYFERQVLFPAAARRRRRQGGS